MTDYRNSGVMGMTLADLTLTDQVAGVDMDGPNYGGLQSRSEINGPQFYGVLHCPYMLFGFPQGPSMSDPAFLVVPFLDPVWQTYQKDVAGFHFL